MSFHCSCVDSSCNNGLETTNICNNGIETKKMAMNLMYTPIALQKKNRNNKSCRENGNPLKIIVFFILKHTWMITCLILKHTWMITCLDVYLLNKTCMHTCSISFKNEKRYQIQHERKMHKKNNNSHLQIHQEIGCI